MADFGTAPRRIAGTWYTRTGRRLSDAGQHWWETRYRLGATSGQGNFKPAVSRQITQAQQGPTRATRITAGKALGAEAQRQQQQLLAAGKTASYFTPLAPIASAQDVVSSARKKDILGTGLAAAGFLPFGRLAKAGQLLRRGIEAGKAAEEVPKVTAPVEQVLGATGEAKRVYGAQKKLRKAARAERIQTAASKYGEAGGGLAGHYAARAALKGELPTVHFGQLTNLDAKQMGDLVGAAYKSDLPMMAKHNLANALIEANKGKVIRPFEVKLIERAFGPEAAAEASTAHRLGREVMHGVSEVANVPRSLMSTLDLSFTLRQALMAFAHDPKLVAKNVPMSVRALGSEKHYQKIMKSIEEHPSFQAAQDAGVKFTDLANDEHVREEAFMSGLAEKATGAATKVATAGLLKHGPVRASARAYTAMQNTLRLQIFHDLTTEAARQGVESSKLTRDAARFANWATGRGELPGRMETAAPLLNSVLFSPRLLASRVQTFNPFFYKGLHPLVRKKALAATGKLAAGGAGVAAASTLGGATVGLDPTSADFGKIKLDNTRFDIWGGHQQLARLVGQLATGKITSSTTGKALQLKGGHDLSRLDVLQRFAESKLSPTASGVVDFLKGQDYAGRPFNLKNEVVSRAYPLTIQDALDLYRQTHSIPKSAGTFGIGALGVGVQTYGEKPRHPGSGQFIKPGSLPHINEVGVRLGHGGAGVRIGGGGGGSGFRLGSGRSGFRLQHIDQVGKRLGH
jgi:hypothetical protein